MSNLGPYQDITTAAKAAGGVPALIKNIERAAVIKASPWLVLTGLLAGVGATVGTTYANRRAERAKAALRASETHPCPPPPRPRVQPC